VTVDAGTWWSVSLDAPTGRGAAQVAPVRVRLRRHGAPESPLVDREVEMHIPLPELDAVSVALQGVVTQARRDGII